MAKEYGLIEGDKRVNEIAKSIQQINDWITGGAYIPQKGDPNFVRRGQKVQLPQFSAAYNNLVAQRNALEQERQQIVSQLARKANSYQPPPGPTSGIIKKEVELRGKYINAPVAPTTAAPTTTATPPGPQQGPQLSESTTFQARNNGSSPSAPAPTAGRGVGATAGMTPRERRTATNWEARVQAEAGEYAYLLDPKYEGVPELLRKAIEKNYFKSDEGKAQFLQEFAATPYGQNTSKKQIAFDTKSPGDKAALVQAEIDKIRAEYGEIQLDQAALEEVATAAARNGASEIERGRLVYRAAFKRGAAAPDYTAPVAAQTALGGNDADRIRTIYRAYGVKADDQQIARILAQEADPVTGTVMTEDMLRNNLRDLAKVSYQPFADLLDRGLSVETIFSPYQQIAARVLEKSTDEVALTNANGVPTEFATALMGEKPMSLTDWITRLKSDERYGWQFTSEAKQKATNLVMDLEKAFGFRA